MSNEPDLIPVQQAPIVLLLEDIRYPDNTLLNMISNRPSVAVQYSSLVKVNFPRCVSSPGEWPSASSITRSSVVRLSVRPLSLAMDTEAAEFTVHSIFRCNNRGIVRHLYIRRT